MRNESSDHVLSSALLLSLSGDATTVPDLQALSDEFRDDEHARSVLQWATHFAATQGRKTTLDSDFGLVNPRDLTAVDFLTWPLCVGPALRASRIEDEIRTLEDSTKAIAAANHSINIDGSISPGAFGLMTLGKGLGRLLYLVSELHGQQGDWQKAADFIAAATDVDPENAQILNWHGYALINLEQYEASIPYLQQSIEEGRNDGWPHTNLGRALQALGRFEDAERVFKFVESDEIKPRFPFELGQQLRAYASMLLKGWPEDRERRDKAKDLLLASVPLSVGQPTGGPTPSEVLINVARLMIEDGEFVNADEVLTAASRLATPEAEQHETIADLRQKLKNLTTNTE